MSFASNTNRYEIKMVFNNTSRFEVVNWVRLHSLAFLKAFPNRQVNNIYFDTFSMDTFNDHVKGILNRRKLRFRWYGQESDKIMGQLELKHKNGSLGWKSIQPIASYLNLEGTSWADIQQSLQEEANIMFKEMLAISRPVLINVYQRQYYVSADGQVRLTLDYDLRAYNQLLVAFPNLVNRLPSRDLVLIELKTGVENATKLADVLAEFPLSVEAFSKYVEFFGRALE